MRELIERLDKLQRQWYAAEIASDEFAYEVFDITSKLKWTTLLDEHNELCQVICVCD